MNTIAFIILTIIGLAITPFILKAVVLAIWQVVEIPYRIVMLTIYGSLYVLISIWEGIVWAVKLPGRVCKWLCSR